MGKGVESASVGIAVGTKRPCVEGWTPREAVGVASLTVHTHVCGNTFAYSLAPYCLSFPELSFIGPSSMGYLDSAPIRFLLTKDRGRAEGFPTAFESELLGFD